MKILFKVKKSTLKSSLLLASSLILFGVFTLAAHNAIAESSPNSTNLNIKETAAEISSRVRIERKARGVDAELVEGGAFYVRKDGKRIQYLRKRGVHIVNQTVGGTSIAPMINQQVKAGEIEQITQHQLGQRIMFRALESAAGQSNSIKSLLDNAQPVFANAEGEGDIEVLPFVTLKLKPESEPDKAIVQLGKQFDLRLLRKLRVSGNVYSFAMQQRMSDPDQAFALVRALNHAAIVDWAEPQFNAKPIKHATTNDTLFNQQWHLNNTTQNGALCDADCDATLAWNTHKGNGTVIAIIDDGVQLNHPDLVTNLWKNLDETPNNGIDDDGNGYVDDYDGYDFVNDNSSQGNSCFDGVVGPDGDPSPQPTSTTCLDIDGESVVEDDHGTAVAGIAAARGNNGQGVAGVAYEAKILPIRAISSYDNGDFCGRIAEAMTYAGRYADVINNSWEMQTNCMALEDAIDDVVAGTIIDNNTNVSKRANKGSPVIFAAGNNAAGWYKVSVNVPAGEHEFEWRFTRGNAYDPFQSIENLVWLDDIQWPNGSIEGFEASGFNDFKTGCDINRCTLVQGACALDTTSCNSLWSLSNQAERARGGMGRSLKADLSSNTDNVCDYTYLTTKRRVSSGTLSFWIWASADFSLDKMEFLVNGREKSSFGDLPKYVQNEVSYPANLASTIAVGASTDGIFMDNNNAIANLGKEERAYYSQYGAALDIVAPSGNQHQGITTTDRTGIPGYNSTANLRCNPATVSECDYTNLFGGTSASAPMVSGAAALILSAQPNLTGAQVRAFIQDGAEQIGPYTYSANKSDETGHGRLNVFNSLKLAQGVNPNASTELCLMPEAYVTDNIYNSVDKKDRVLNYCPSQVFVSDELCFPIKAKNGNVAVICL